MNQAAVTLHDLLFQRVKRSETDSCNDQCFGPEFQMRLGSDEQFFASDVQTEQEKSGSLQETSGTNGPEQARFLS